MTDLEDKRGCDFHDFPDSTGIFLIQADIESVSAGLAKSVEGKAEAVVLGQADERWQRPVAYLVWQYQGHSWSIFVGEVCQEELARSISEQLETVCIYLQYEDSAAVTGYLLFNQGIVLEEYNYAPDYADELAEEDPDTADLIESQRSEWDVWTIEDEVEYRFRSQLRKAAAEISAGQSFIDAFFRRCSMTG